MLFKLQNDLNNDFRAWIGNFLQEFIVRSFFGKFLPLETAEVCREDHKEHLPNLRLPTIVVFAAQSGSKLTKMIPKQ